MATTTMEQPPSNPALKKSQELLKGIIYPSREIRGIIDKTAIHIAKSPSPQLLEDRIREHQKADPKFSFLRDSDPFNCYYRYMIEKVKEDGEEAALTLGGEGTTSNGPVDNEATTERETEVQRKERENLLKKAQLASESLEEPSAFEFTADLPNVTSIDLDILRLTAMFTARRGRRFLESLSVREGRNYQFDFLRPTHSLHGYFNRMVEQYNRILHPTELQLSSLKSGATSQGKWDVLKECQNRGQWEKIRKDKDQKKKDEAEKEAQAFAEIDWQDFAVVQNIEFTSADQTIDLPPPTSIEALNMMGLNEKRMAAMIVVETEDDMGDVGALNGQSNGIAEEEMAEEEDGETREQRLREAEELARAREIQAKAMGQAGMKIRKDYQPKGGAGRQTTKGKVPMAICPYCKLPIPETEISEHIRIEGLDPRWREQKEFLEQRKAQQALLTQNADVAGSLKQLSNARTDLFGTADEEDARKQQEDAERAARKAKEAIIWDGHTASKASTLETFQTKFNLDDQIAAIHRKNQLLPSAQGAIGPQMGTSSAEVSNGSVAFTGASISAGPSAPSAIAPVNPYGQFIPFPDQPAFDPSMFNNSPMPSYPAADSGPRPGMHPSRAAAIGDMNNQPPTFAGQVRPFDGGDPGAEPEAKRPRIDKLPGGHFYPEAEWIAMHPDPISISVRLPNMPEKPEWKLNGAIITIPDLPLNFLVSTLRDRIAGIIEAQLPISRMRLDYGPKVLSNANTLASVNLDEGDEIVLTIRKK